MISELQQQLHEFGQDHLLQFWDGLTSEQRDHLVAQIGGLDLPLVARLAQDIQEGADWHALASRAEAPAAFELEDPHPKFSVEEANDRGEAALKSGQLGVIIVAGGQGTRLGFDHPKGMYPIGPMSQRTLFQIHIEQLRALARRYGVSIPLYLMTSPATHDETIDFLEKHDRFGLSRDDLHVFCQGTMPAIDQRGRLILSSPSEIFLSPDGHGGTVAALLRSGCLADMEGRGIQQIFYAQVDNPLVEFGQRDLVGYHLLSQSEMTTEVVRKKHPLDKVGNVVKVDGKMMIIEYSDLPDALADRRNAQGLPIFWAGSIAVHVFERTFLERAATQVDLLPFHRAHKVVPYCDDRGNVVTPDRPNAIKFERFIFDLMPAARQPIAVEALESRVFAPLKNASGAAKDTPESTQAALMAKHRRMFEQVGIPMAPGIEVEVSPLFALDADELRRRWNTLAIVQKSQFFPASNYR